jgi:hypothetical protein
LRLGGKAAEKRLMLGGGIEEKLGFGLTVVLAAYLSNFWLVTAPV